MILPMFLFALSISARSAQSLECANFVDRRTEFHSNEAGLKIALRVHAADDHSKESHLCMTDYFFVIIRPDGTSTERSLDSIDDSWGRSVKFWIDGYALRGRRLIATIVERGGSFSIFQIVIYNVQTGKADILEIPQQFLERIPPSCRESFGAIGLTRLGDPVIGFKNSPCGGMTKMWKLEQGPMISGVQRPSHPIRLSDRSIIEPIEPGATSAAK